MPARPGPWGRRGGDQPEQRGLGERTRDRDRCRRGPARSLVPEHDGTLRATTTSASSATGARGATTPDNLLTHNRVYHADGLGSVRALTNDPTRQVDPSGLCGNQVCAGPSPQAGGTGPDPLVAGPLLVPAAGAVGEGAEVVGGGVCVLSGACEAVATAAVVVGTAVAVGVGVGELIQHRKEIADTLGNVVFAKTPSGAFLDTLNGAKAKGGRKRWTDDEGRIYEWDRSHGGELEVYDKRGRHIGVRSPQTGDWIKPAVKGRSIEP